MHQSKTSTLRANKKIDMVERKFFGPNSSYRFRYRISSSGDKRIIRIYNSYCGLSAAPASGQSAGPVPGLNEVKLF